MKYTPKIGDLIEWNPHESDVLDPNVVETWWGIVVGKIPTPNWAETKENVWIHVFWMDTKTIEAEVSSNLRPIQERKPCS